MSEQEVFAIASQYLRKVKRTGGENISALCPFHAKTDGSEEKHPSFSMSLTKGVWHCFTCHASGTFQRFLQNVGMPRAVVVNQYGELLNSLHKKAGPGFNALKPGVVVQEPLPEAILGLFEKCPVYLVDPEFSVLLDPDDPVVFEEALLQQYDIGFDEVHERITFPLRDFEGNLVGFTGRTVTGAYPRYKVYDLEYKDLGYPARTAPQKGALLWNIDRVYPGLFFGPNDQFVLVVEGLRGALWAIQSGVRNTVALLGSYLSKQQKWMLERLGCQVYLMLDNDEAGQRALRGRVDDHGRRWPGIAEELSKSLDVFIVNYEGKQPTRLTQEALCAAVNSADDYYRWVLKKENAHVVR